MIYYRRYVGDYLKDTSKLSLLEHGAYTIMLDYYYAEEQPLPLDLGEIYRMARAMLPEERLAIDKVLFRYFTKGADGYHNARADEEIEVSRTARENGAKGGRPRTGNGTGHETGDETQTITGSGHPSTFNLQPSSVTHQPPDKAATAALPEILPSNIPYKEIVSLFNEHMGQLPMVRELTLKRRQLIRAAWMASKVRRDLKFWKAYYEEAQDDPFLNGTGPYGKGHENWRPTFDYLMRNDVITKTYEKAMSRER